MRSMLLIIAAPVALALLASVAFAEQGEAPGLGPFVLPPSDINENIQVIPPQVIPPEVGSPIHLPPGLWHD